MRLAVIPARGGSKRIPRKNIKPFCGKPIMAWPIAAALQSGCFDRVVVSTEDEEIAEVARACGAETPFLRPADLANDHTGAVPVVAQCVDWHRRQGADISQVCCIYATAPFLRPEDLARGLAILEREGCDYAFSVTRFAFPIQRALRRVNDRVEMFWPETVNVRSQDLEPAYHDAGQFYWGKASAWLRNASVFSRDAAPIFIERHRVQDIDDNEDWITAEWMFKAMGASQRP